MDIPNANLTFMIGFVFSISIFAGICLTFLETHNFRNSRLNRIRFFLCILPIAFISCDLYSVNSKIFASAFPYPAPNISRNESFRQIIGDDHKMYPAFLRNEGTLNAYEPTHFPTKAIAKTDRRYRGEVFLTTKGEATISYWSPNKVIVQVKAKEGGNLVLNQNFAPNWKADNGKKVESYDGLISTKVTPEDEQITFYYLPVSFMAGSILSLSSIVLSFFL